MSTPISPKDVQKKKINFPPEVFDIFNEQIHKEWDGKKAIVHQSTVRDILANRLNLEHYVIFENHYLDVEDEYKAVGWKVDYIKGAFHDKSFFVFTK
ncbi:hypothetical protein M0R04_04860 [Candidatus Dojkabacteria bacterium]|jgi:hypothetical protein|nr:hypothetical protein [Candidatus Dojkabacteria bacterium]